MKVINNKQFIFLQMNIFGTLVGIFMPALLPKCSAMYEVGCYYIDGDNIDKLFVDSPDGLIQCNHNMNRANCCQPDVYGLNSGNKSVEIKSPYPDGNNMPVHYSIPRYYILQCIIHMIVTNTIENWYASGGLTRVVLICCSMDLQLWHVVWMKIKEFLDKVRPVA